MFWSISIHIVLPVTTTDYAKIIESMYMLHFYECFLWCAVYEYVIFFAGKFKPVIKKAMVELEGI